MRKVMTVLLALVTGFVMGTGAWSVQATGFFNGGRYLESTFEFQGGYIAGVSDALSLDYDASALAKFKKCKRGMTLGQLKTLVDNYLKTDPQNRNKAMASLVWSAVVVSCPD